jgi:hypothetical protein
MSSVAFRSEDSSYDDDEMFTRSLHFMSKYTRNAYLRQGLWSALTNGIRMCSMVKKKVLLER